MKTKKYSIRAIARALGRGTSSIADEIIRNSVRGTYDPRKAQHKAYVRRKYARYQGMKIVHHDGLRRFVRASLLDGQSPEAIAGRICTHEHGLPRVSPDTILRFLKSTYGNRIALALATRKQRRRKIRACRTKLSRRIFITNRPLYIEARTRVGDVEADFIVSGKTGRGILLVVVDRKTRATFMNRVLPVSIRNMEKAFLHIKARFPEMRTVTTDNDILFQKHEVLAQLLPAKFYFCLPHHPWEKGTVENTNRAIRRDISKGSDISRYTTRFIQLIEAKLNRRPMQVLNYQTPQEALALHRQHPRKTKKPR